MVAQLIGRCESEASTFDQARPGRRLDPHQRQAVSVEVLAGTPVSEVARRHGVSRQTCYRQADAARTALEDAFTCEPESQKVLFHLPVTKHWLHQLVLALVLIGHSSFRGVIEILQAVLDDQPMSLGTIHRIVSEAVVKARAINQAQDLSGIRVGAHDEIFQAGKPVLVGADVDSTYCYLLEASDHRDQTSWGVHLLDLADRGLAPQYTIADGGQGIRAGQAAAWPATPCHGEVFHAQRELGRLAYYLENRAKGCTTAREKLERQIQRHAKRGQGNRLSRRLALARQEEARAVNLAQDVRILCTWLQQDVLAQAGPDLTTRRELFDYIVEQLHQRQALCPHRIGPVARMLGRQREQLLAFAGVLQERLEDVAMRLGIPAPLVQAVCELQGLDRHKSAHWQRRAALHRELGPRLHEVETAVQQVLAQTPRASSIVENLNSRLRNYFFLRRHLGNDYLTLLRFFLNHRRFLRSERPEREGKSPAQLLSGQDHPHWLELLGYQRFHRN